jgi:plasmid stabilization system protein ParE
VIWKVRLLGRALADLEEIRRYVERDRPEAARRLLSRLLDVIDTLRQHPERALRPRDKRLRALGYRFVVVRPYLSFFKMSTTTVRVYRVLHGHERYQAVL